MMLDMSCPPWGLAFAWSRSCSVTSWTISFFFVHVTLGHGHVLVRLQVELRGKRVAPANAPRDATVRLDVDDVPDLDFLFLQALVNLRGQLQGLLALGGLQADHHRGHLLAVAARRIWSLLGRQLGDLALVHLLGLLDADPDGPPTVLHQDLRLLNLGGVDLAPDHGAEGDLHAELLSYSQGQRGLASARSACHQERPSGHLLGPDEVDDHPAGLPSLLLPHEPAADRQGLSVLSQAKALDVAVRRNPLRLGGGLDLLDLHGAASQISGGDHGDGHKEAGRGAAPPARAPARQARSQRGPARSA